MNNSRKILKTHIVSFIPNSYGIPSVFALFRKWNPIAVLRSVISIHVSPLNRNTFFPVLFRCLRIRIKHIFIKILKFFPGFVNAYSSSAVKLKLFAVLIPNSPEYLAPSCIKSGVRHPMFKTKANRMGKVIRLTDQEISYYTFDNRRVHRAEF